MNSRLKWKPVRFPFFLGTDLVLAEVKSERDKKDESGIAKNCGEYCPR